MTRDYSLPKEFLFFMGKISRMVRTYGMGIMAAFLAAAFLAVWYSSSIWRVAPAGGSVPLKFREGAPRQEESKKSADPSVLSVSIGAGENAPFPLAGIPASSDRQEQSAHASLLVGGAVWPVAIPKGGSALNLMEKARADHEIEFTAKEFSGLGAFVTAINGISQNPLKGLYWIYYINGNKAKVGISTYIVQDNDTIEWKYESEE